MTDQEYLRRLGLLVKEARIKSGMTQIQLAASCNLAKANLSRIESGKTYHGTYTQKIMRGTGDGRRGPAQRILKPEVAVIHF